MQKRSFSTQTKTQDIPQRFGEHETTQEQLHQQISKKEKKVWG
jgi:hypothetical protein